MRQKQIVAEVGMLGNLLKRQMACVSMECGEQNLTGMQALLIRHLLMTEEQGDCFQRDLEEKFRWRRSTATGMLQLMEQHGLIRREPVERDARLKRLVLTDRARALGQYIQTRLDETETHLREGINEQELATWFAVCEKLRTNLENSQRKASEDTL